MDIAVIIGADNSFGISIARKLIALGLRVYGLGQDFSRSTFSHKYFTAVKCDLGNGQSLTEAIEALTEQGKAIGVLVSITLPEEGRLFTSLSSSDCNSLLSRYLIAPTVSLRLLLPSLELNEGHCIFIGPEYRSYSQPSFLENITGSHIQTLADRVFSDYRDAGVKVSTLLGASNSEISESVSEYNQPESRLNPVAIADAVEKILRYQDGNVVTQLVVRPQRSEETKRKRLAASDEYQQVQLPTPDKFPQEPEPILTPKPKKKLSNRTRAPQKNSQASKKRQLPASDKKEGAGQKKSRINSLQKKKTTFTKKRIGPELSVA